MSKKKGASGQKSAPQGPFNLSAVPHMAMVTIPYAGGELKVAATPAARQRTFFHYRLGKKAPVSTNPTESKKIRYPFKLVFLRDGAEVAVKMDSFTFALLLSEKSKPVPNFWLRFLVGPGQKSDDVRPKDFETDFDYGSGNLDVLLADMAMYKILNFAKTKSAITPIVTLANSVLQVKVGEKLMFSVDLANPLPAEYAPMADHIAILAKSVNAPDALMKSSGVKVPPVYTTRAVAPEKILWPARNATNGHTESIVFLTEYGVVYGTAPALVEALSILDGWKRDEEYAIRNQAKIAAKQGIDISEIPLVEKPLVIPEDSNAWVESNWLCQGKKFIGSAYLPADKIGYVKSLCSIAPASITSQSRLTFLKPIAPEGPKGYVYLSLKAAQLVGLPRHMQYFGSPGAWSAGEIRYLFNTSTNHVVALKGNESLQDCVLVPQRWCGNSKADVLAQILMVAAGVGTKIFTKSVTQPVVAPTPVPEASIEKPLKEQKTKTTATKDKAPAKSEPKKAPAAKKPTAKAKK